MNVSARDVEALIITLLQESALKSLDLTLSCFLFCSFVTGEGLQSIH